MSLRRSAITKLTRCKHKYEISTAIARWEARGTTRSRDKGAIDKKMEKETMLEGDAMDWRKRKPC